MSQPAQCPHCGAKITAGAQRFCTYCGVALPRAVPPAVIAAPDPREVVRQRFEALRAHPRFEELMRRTPRGRGPRRKSSLASFLPVVVLGVMFFAVASGSGIANRMEPMPQLGPHIEVRGSGPFAAVHFLLSVAIVLVPLIVILKILRGGKHRSRTAPRTIARVPARVAGARTEVLGGGDVRSATRYFVTLEDDHGSRQEYVASGIVKGQLAEDDLGVAYIHDGMLVEYQRVRV